MTSEPVEFAKPFPGLRPFEFSESPLFYGRGAHIVGMLQILRQHHFLAVVGSSGCGKSSLVRAGLLPALDRGYLGKRDANWHFVIMKPGDDPFANLARSLISQSQIELTDDTVASCVETLRHGPRGLLDAIDRFLSGDNRSVLVLVDQFEEIFRFTRHDRDIRSSDRDFDPEGLDDAIAFVDLLLSTAEMKQPQIHVALTMRSDFLGDCDAFRDLPEAINRSQFLPPRLTREDLRDAIERPPQNPQFDGPPDKDGNRTKSRIEPEVVSELLAAMGDRQDQLPLIQHALLRMWSVAEGPDNVRPVKIDVDVMRRCGIQDSGNVAGALDQHADLVYDGLATDDVVQANGMTNLKRRVVSPIHEPGGSTMHRRQRIAARLFCCLSERSPKGQLIRRVTSVQEVAEVADVSPQEVIEIVEVFSEPGVHFLMTSPVGAITSATKIDISHECLLRQWGTMREWIEKESIAATRYRRLQETVRLNSRLGGTELIEVWRWRRNDKPTPAWAERYGGKFKECMDLLRKSLIRTGLGIAFALAFAIVVFFLINIAIKYDAVKQAANEKEAALILASIGGGTEYPTAEEFGEYNKLANEPEEVRIVFLKQLMLVKEDRYRKKHSFALHAIVGLDPATRNKVRNILIENATPPEKERELNIATASLGILLDIEEDAKLRDMIAANLHAALQKAFGTEKPAPLVDETIGEIEEMEQFDTDFKKTATMLHQAIEDFRKLVIDKPMGPAELQHGTRKAVVDAIQTSKLNSPARGRWLSFYDGFFDGMSSGEIGNSTTGYDWITSLSVLMNALKLSSGTPVVHSDISSVDLAALLECRQLIASLGEILLPEQASILAQQIVSTMKKTTNPDALSELGSALGSLGEKLPENQAQSGAQQILTVMESTTDPSALSSLARALGSFREKLCSEQYKAAIRIILGAMEKRADSVALGDYTGALVALGEKLPDEIVLACTKQLLSALEAPNAPYELSYDDGPPFILGEILSDEQAAEVARLVVEAMGKTSNPSHLAFFAKTLQGFGEKLPYAQALAGAQRIVVVIATTKEPGANYSLVNSLDVLVTRVSEEQALKLSHEIVAAMDDAKGPTVLSTLGFALSSLGNQLPADQTAAARRQILDAKRMTTDPAELLALDVVSSLLATPTDEQVLIGAKHILVAMENASGPAELDFLSDTLGAMAVWMTPDDIASVLKSVVCVGDVRNKFLAGLEKREKVGESFDNNLWKAVAWLEEQGVDVEKVPRFPIVESE